MSAAPRGKIVAVSTSRRKGEKKIPVPSASLVRGHGIPGDAHAGPGYRQVSLLSVESIAKMRALGLSVGPGDFAENVTVEGIEIATLPIGSRIRIGSAVVEITQIGKECHERCAIYFRVGDCVMPREGVFGRVVVDGSVAPGDIAEVVGG